MFGFIDESGAPGVATNKNDFLLVSLVIFDSEEKIERSSAMIEKLRAKLGLTDDYEFHCARNSTLSQKEFVKLLSRMDFKFITVAIRKNNSKNTASYGRIAKILTAEILSRFPNIKIEMDSNPTLYSELRKQLKVAGINASLRQAKSHTNDMLQVADYIANLSAKKCKKATSATEKYRQIERKVLNFIKIEE